MCLERVGGNYRVVAGQLKGLKQNWLGRVEFRDINQSPFPSSLICEARQFACIV